MSDKEPIEIEIVSQDADPRAAGAVMEKVGELLQNVEDGDRRVKFAIGVFEDE